MCTATSQEIEKIEESETENPMIRDWNDATAVLDVAHKATLRAKNSEKNAEVKVAELTAITADKKAAAQVVLKQVP